MPGTAPAVDMVATHTTTIHTVGVLEANAIRMVNTAPITVDTNAGIDVI